MGKEYKYKLVFSKEKLSEADEFLNTDKFELIESVKKSVLVMFVWSCNCAVWGIFNRWLGIILLLPFLVFFVFRSVVYYLSYRRDKKVLGCLESLSGKVLSEREAERVSSLVKDNCYIELNKESGYIDLFVDKWLSRFIYCR